MDNLLPDVSGTLEAIERRSRPTRQWEPAVSEDKKGVLPAKLRARLREEAKTDSPVKAEAKSSLPLPVMSDYVQAKEECEGRAMADPSPLAAGERGRAPAARMARVTDHPRPPRQLSKKGLGMDKSPTVVTFINHLPSDLDPHAKETSPRDQTLSVFFRGEQSGASMSNHYLTQGDILHQAVGGRLPSALHATLDPHSPTSVDPPSTTAGLAQMELHGVSVLLTSRRALEQGGDFRAAFDEWESQCSKVSAHQRWVSFRLDEPLGVELEYDPIEHSVFVHRILAYGQAQELGVVRGDVIGRVTGRRVNTLEQFEDRLEAARQLEKPILRVLLVSQDRGGVGSIPSSPSTRSRESIGLGLPVEKPAEDEHGLPGWSFATGEGVEGSMGQRWPVQAEREEAGGGSDELDELVAGRLEPARGGREEAVSGEAKGKEAGEEKVVYPAQPRVPEQPIPVLPAGMGTSLEDAWPVTLYFVNQTTHMAMEVCWIDYEGRLVPRKLLQPGDVHLESSWSTHPWMLSAVEPPPFDPDYHDDPEEADRHQPEPHEDDMTVVVRCGDVAARDEQRRYSLLWHPRDRTMSFMPAAKDRITTELREDLRPENATDSRTRIRNTRAALVHSLRALRADPSGGANGGEPPVLTVFMMGQRRGESVIGPLMQAKEAAWGGR